MTRAVEIDGGFALGLKTDSRTMQSSIALTTRRAGGIPRSIDFAADRFVFSDEKKLSMAVLSWTLRDRPIKQVASPHHGRRAVEIGRWVFRQNALEGGAVQAAVTRISQ